MLTYLIIIYLGIGSVLMIIGITRCIKSEPKEIEDITSSMSGLILYNIGIILAIIVWPIPFILSFIYSIRSHNKKETEL